jgi:hypothetical protein
VQELNLFKQKKKDPYGLIPFIQIIQKRQRKGVRQSISDYWVWRGMMRSESRWM